MFKQEAINAIRTGEIRKRNSNIPLTESERTAFTILPDLLEGHEFFIDFDAMEKELSKVKPYELQKIIDEERLPFPKTIISFTIEIYDLTISSEEPTKKDFCIIMYEKKQKAIILSRRHNNNNSWGIWNNIFSEEAKIQESVRRMIAVCRYAVFLLLHCKNIGYTTKSKMVPIKTKKRKSNKVRTKYKKVEYKILTLKLTPKQRESMGIEKDHIEFGTKGIHWGKGTYRTYKKDSDGKGGLFGKHEGTWYFSPCIKGWDTNKLIKKDYKINKEATK